MIQDPGRQQAERPGGIVPRHRTNSTNTQHTMNRNSSPSGYFVRMHKDNYGWTYPTAVANRIFGRGHTNTALVSTMHDVRRIEQRARSYGWSIKVEPLACRSYYVRTLRELYPGATLATLAKLGFHEVTKNGWKTP